jgi:spore germination protein YaaH
MMKKAIQKNLSGVFVYALFLLFLSFFLFFPPRVHAADNLEVSGWIPYWSGTKGPKDALKHLNALTEIHPFVYSIKSDGTLSDLAGLKKSVWRKLIESARSKDVLVTPTVMASDGALTQKILGDTAKRENHIRAIVTIMKDGEFDGVNIDYEAKLAETKDFFSTFLQELKAAIGTKRLSCTVEPRTPPDSLYKTIPANLQYANDYRAIGTYCDIVEIMAYDQQRADIKLNAARTGAPYLPVADVDWVRKVAMFATQSIPKENLVLGIPTYGTEYEVTVSPDWYQGYRRVRAVNPDTAIALAKKKKAKPTRNSAGEMAFTYTTDATAKVKSYKIPKDTPKGNTVAAQALAYANKTGKTTVFNMVSWSDAKAIEAKVTLAKELGLRGIALFKIDGQEDSGLWNIFDKK